MFGAPMPHRQNIPISLRAVLAAAVALAAALTWAFVWDLGLRLAWLDIFVGAPVGVRVPYALRVGWFLQWILAALSLLLILSLVARPRYIRAIVQTWFLFLVTYAVTGLIAFRELALWSLVSVVPAMVVLAWILYLTGVRPNMRLKLTARVD